MVASTAAEGYITSTVVQSIKLQHIQTLETLEANHEASIESNQIESLSSKMQESRMLERQRLIAWGFLDSDLLDQ
jgi:hypothetical protein